MRFLRNILIIFVPFYYLITSFRNWLYDRGFLKSTEYDLPIICVGNLSVGGTGKTPMIEFLIRIINNDIRIATLSRGYGRKSNGFIVAGSSSNSEELGDEPYQIFRKFPEITVSVDENRRRGIEKLMASDINAEVILLDDAFQHRRVKAGLNILLTPYHDLYTRDMLLPTGNLRETRSGARRAQIIVVTKCPEKLSEGNKNRIANQLKIRSGQHLFFSEIAYSETLSGRSEQILLSEWGKQPFTLLTGIADPSPLVDHLKGAGFEIDHLKFVDHHRFTQDDIEKIRSIPRVLTTEKDFVRLEIWEKLSNIWYLPVQTRIHDSDKFEKIIRDYVVR